jgi:hypothetical protein
MHNYIQIAIQKVKAVDIQQIQSLRRKGHRTIRFKLKVAAPKEKVPTASIPLDWIVDSRLRYEASGSKDETVFKSFVSDWISGWTL